MCISCSSTELASSPLRLPCQSVYVSPGHHNCILKGCQSLPCGQVFFSTPIGIHLSTAFEPRPDGNSPLLVFHCSEWFFSFGGFCFSSHIRLLFKGLALLLFSSSFNSMTLTMWPMPKINVNDSFFLKRDLLLLVWFCITYWKLIIFTRSSNPSHTSSHFPTYPIIVEEGVERLLKIGAMDGYREGSPRYSSGVTHINSQ